MRFLHNLPPIGTELTSWILATALPLPLILLLPLPLSLPLLLPLLLPSEALRHSQSAFNPLAPELPIGGPHDRGRQQQGHAGG